MLIFTSSLTSAMMALSVINPFMPLRVIVPGPLKDLEPTVRIRMFSSLSSTAESITRLLVVAIFISLASLKARFWPLSVPDPG